MIDAAHLKGLYKGTNLVAVAMDGNNQIVPIAFGICKGETGPCWSWWMSVLKECIGDNPNLLFISDRHATITMAVENEFPLDFHVPDAYENLCRAGPQRLCNQHEHTTKEPVLKLAETYRAMVKEWYYKRRQLASVNEYQYQVSDGQYIRAVNLQTGICECRKWQLSGLPCGHVIAITRFLGLTDCVQYVADWFKKPKYQGTYSESIHFLGNMQQWEFPQNIQKAIPPRMDNPQPGRPKNTNRIQSQGEEPRVIQCSRCKQAGHKRDQCSQPFVVQPPVNIRTQNDQEIPRNNQPSFYNPTQHYDNTFHNINHYTSQQYGATTYPSQPYCETPYPSQPYDQHFTNTSQAYNEHHTESSQMYEQYNSQQYDAQHLDDLNTNGSNSLVPLVDAIQERDTILMYTHHNRLHVYVSRVELSPLIVEEQHSDETNKNENQGKPSCAKKLFA
ncbi:transposase, MuDR, MULE transposase domain protein [Tanacetum coccineum]|uniref:Transposase, MuDR, MULE transposase domain protein n=1 Tax=Tanacetum coccineum TaxID=301880 RepID=A0ABQ5GZU4_9ASTR